ncbi:MAG: hypothetical protein NTZ90_08655 [Proteobacteria bacterium]|nr:hypothetical protein [Pseudomonadota bacterium]
MNFNHKILVVTTLATMASCRTAQASSIANSSEVVAPITLHGSEAEQLRHVLKDAGVQSQPGAEGVDAVSASAIECHNDHTTSGPVECVVSSSQGDLPANGDLAVTLFKILSAHASGHPHRVEAANVSCRFTAGGGAGATDCTLTL